MKVAEKPPPRKPANRGHSPFCENEHPNKKVSVPFSTPRELGFPLFEKSRRSFLFVVRLVTDRLCECLDEKAGIEIDARGGVQRELGQPRGERPVLENALGQLAGAHLKLRRRHDGGDEANLQRLLRVDDVAGENEMSGPALTDDARQSLGRAGGGDDAQTEL